MPILTHTTLDLPPFVLSAVEGRKPPASAEPSRSASASSPSPLAHLEGRS